MALIPRYFDLLVLLIERRNEAVTRGQILDRVWSDVVVSDGALSQAVRTLRRTHRFSGWALHTETVRLLLQAAPELRLAGGFRGRRTLAKARREGCAELLSLVQPFNPGS